MKNKIFFPALILLLFSCRGKPKEKIGANEYYVCSMDPQVMEKQPGPCPLCKMPLSKVTIDTTENVVRLSKEQIRLGNIQTNIVKYDSIGEEKTLTGVFAINQNSQQQVSSRFNGRIEKLYRKIPGQSISEGDLIYDVYSRDLMQAEQEYIFALDRINSLSGSTNNKELSESAKNKLVLWGLTEKQIDSLVISKNATIVNHIYSKVSGTITEIPFREGDYIDEGSTIFKLADLSSLWVEAQIYSGELGTFEFGDQAEITPEAFPDETIEGEIDFANPSLQPETKINLLRIRVSNAKKEFIPGMMAFVVLRSKTKKAITLPTDAVIQNGKFSHIWIRIKDGTYQARKVETGIQTKTKIEIISGLSEGEEVVTSGAYLVYSDYVFARGKYPFAGSAGNAMGNMKMDHH
ncbi:MAG: efflux RND transporter periplasmic adaptor subunit [Bacteroidetes bacterium]|nr:efflux RND transporter periplasmic adaptor subunit [Bacteroidota bacterium]